jgi:transposase
MNGLNLKIIGKWLISDELWEQFKPLIPVASSPPSWHGGRPHISDRDAMNGIFFVLKTGG